ncbi:receptor-like protein kinase ANXUR2 [Cucurbita pepo subsp. pepo]|uniref:receptor-like protein kinase ANXUR2 n=1 Tax=Cucurbita pepo subsp. pepo TaxID=3664 RepID=UPI000C9D2FB5|nr:receptor-like protein kinase ANXUR2 [Cucurbita pepo subsp. pepo]
MNANTHVMFSLFFLFLALFTPVYSSPLLASDPPLLLRCGSNEESTDDIGRKWTPDSKFLPSKNTLMVSAGFQDPSITSQVPYMEARIFTSATAYKFPIKPGNRYWLRLHFYPSTYGIHDSANSFFTIAANDLSLAKNFSVHLTCQALTQAYIVREFTLAASASETLNLTFTPVTGFAFVNGIELVQMPEIFGEAVMIGGGRQTTDVTKMSMQTVARLNVGGSYISPVNDSGMTRTWYDDFPYLYGAAEGVAVEAAKRLVINYKDMPSYIAPEEVYRSLRSMGTEASVNGNYNLTWLFPNIDPGFMYLMRLHFCDLTLSRANQVVFDVFINNQTADTRGIDVIAWSGGRGVPKYRDYVVFSPEAATLQEIWLALHPKYSESPEFADAMLNGLEIFKLESGKNLAGMNPQTSAFRMKLEGQGDRKFEAKSNNVEVIGGAAGGAAAFVVVALCFAVYQRKNRMPGSDSHTASWLPIYGNSHSSGSKSTVSGKSMASNLAQGLARHFSLAEILNATKNFSESNVIGVGGFGKVYKGVIDGGTKVAIKRSNPQSEQGVHEFLTEIDLLSKLRHKHLVSLIGFCDEENEMCLIYDYMGLGTLREHLYKTNNNKTRLSWKKRLEICIGAARGLHYLHTGAQYTIIHRDVKTTNILLDENWVAKVSDFGLSKTGPNMANGGHVSTVVKGSFGYLDPEYFRRQQLTEKSDVYSFGVVLFEVLCARPALNPSLPKEQVSLADWALHCKRKGVLDDLIDPYLKGKITPDSLKKFADAAEKCLDDHGAERPSMGDVLWNLEFALQLQESADGGGSSHRSRINSSSNNNNNTDVDNHRNQDMTAHYNNLSLGSEQDLLQQTDEQESTEIFSQLVHPSGR